MSRESPVKCWCFTYHAKEGESLHEWLEYQWTSGMYTYMVAQVERGEETGKEHLQGFCVLGTKRRSGQMKKLDGRAHWEQMRGTIAQAVAYCKKEETRIDGPWEYGEIRGAGRPTTLELVGDMIKAGKSDKEIAEEATAVYIRCYKGIQATRVALKIAMPMRDWAPEIWILWGPSRTGKSAFARHNWPGAYWKPKDRQDTYWWDGYMGEEVVVIDDMCGSRMKLTDAQNLMDRYPLQVPYKGGYHSMLAKVIVFTTNVHPDEWFKNDVAHSILGRINDFAQGRFLWCDFAPWEDAMTGQVWQPPSGVTVPDFVVAKWHAPSQARGARVPDFPGNTGGNPAPADPWEALRDNGR